MFETGQGNRDAARFAGASRALEGGTIPDRALESGEAHEPDTPGPLRVGVFAESPLQPRWIIEACARIAARRETQIVVLAVGAGMVPQRPWLWRAYDSVDRSFFGSGRDPSERMALQVHLPHLPVMAVPAGASGSDRYRAWLAAVARLRLDVAFALDDVADRLPESIATLGILTYCFGDDHIALEHLAGVREAALGEPVTPSGMKLRRGGGEDRLLYQSWSRTYPFSIRRNRENCLRKSSEFAARVLQELQRGGEDWLNRCPRPLLRPHGVEDPTCDIAATVRQISRLGGRVAQRVWQKLFYLDQWFLAYRFAAEERWQNMASGFTRLMPPKDRYWADPFVIERGGRYYVFFEDLPYARGKAHIAMMEVNGSGICGDPVPVLERDYHLSYPFLIEEHGELFMVPETLENGTVELYRCTDFPARWRREAVLLDQPGCADATLHREGGRWWMFVNIGFEGTEAHDELHIFVADRLKGRWKPHPRNPVKSDARCSRPAGALFRRDGMLFRPAQICAPLYGSGVSINRVLELSPQAYREEETTRIFPGGRGGLLGIHTLNRAGRLSIIDAFARRPRLVDS